MTVILLGGDRLNVRIQVSILRLYILSSKHNNIERFYLFFLQKNAVGQDLFNHVVKHIGLRETWYFGLMIIKGIFMPVHN